VIQGFFAQIVTELMCETGETLPFPLSKQDRSTGEDSFAFQSVRGSFRLESTGWWSDDASDDTTTSTRHGAFGFSLFASPGPEVGAPSVLRAAAVDLAESDYIGLVKADSPFAYWPLNDVQGSSIHDEVGTVTGSPVGGVSAVTGNPFSASGTTTRFDGNATRVQPSGLCTGVSFDGKRLQPTGSFSVEAWVKTSDPNGVIFRQRFYGYLLWVTGGQASFETNLGSTGYRNIATGSAVVANGEWHHLVGVHQPLSTGARSLLYVDGELAATATAPASAGPAVLYDSEPDPAALGRDASACDSRLTSLKGNLSHVALYPTALSPARVRAHHGPDVQLGADVNVRNGKTFAYVKNAFPVGTALGFSVVGGPSTGANGVCVFTPNIANNICPSFDYQSVTPTGSAVWAYNGIGLGTDTIRVWIDENRNGTFDRSEPSAIRTVKRVPAID
jgi:Concanavalin A-like lectin/glucanases superfamily